MKAVPDLMTPALSIHNAAIRRAAFANAGSVLEQEGDSYTVVFHEPFDAAVFCLQVCYGRSVMAFLSACRVLAQCSTVMHQLSHAHAFLNHATLPQHCTQVQLLLQALDWPKGLPAPKSLALQEAAAAAAAEAAGGGAGAGGGAPVFADASSVGGSASSSVFGSGEGPVSPVVRGRSTGGCSVRCACFGACGCRDC